MTGTASAMTCRWKDVSPRVGMAALTGLLDLDFPVHCQLCHRILHNASVSAHLLPGQTREGDICL